MIRCVIHFPEESSRILEFFGWSSRLPSLSARYRSARSAISIFRGQERSICRAGNVCAKSIFGKIVLEYNPVRDRPWTSGRRGESDITPHIGSWRDRILGELSSRRQLIRTIRRLWPIFIFLCERNSWTNPWILYPCNEEASKNIFAPQPVLWFPEQSSA